MVEDSTAFSAKDHFAKVFSKVPPTAILPVRQLKSQWFAGEKGIRNGGVLRDHLGTPPLISGYWVGITR